MRACLLLLILTTIAQGQEPRFAFSPGMALTYSIDQTTTVSETTLEDGMPVVGATIGKLNLTRRFDVKSVSPNGVAQLEMSLIHMKQTLNRPGPKDKEGKRTVDSIVIDSATPEGAKQIVGFADKPAFVLQVDGRGQVLEAKTGKGVASPRMLIEPAFRIVWPEKLPASGAAWERTFAVQIDPPYGTGEKYEMTQTFTPKPEASGYMILGVATTLKAPPKDTALMQPLIPYLWEGEVYYEKATNRYAGARLKIQKELTNHAGPGTKFSYETTYVEALAK
jgi:hypothetical protein